MADHEEKEICNALFGIFIQQVVRRWLTDDLCCFFKVYFSFFFACRLKTKENTEERLGTASPVPNQTATDISYSN